MDNEDKNKKIQWHTLIVPILTIILGFGYSKIQNDIGFLNILFCCTIAICIWLGSLCVFSNFFSDVIIRKQTQDKEDIIDTLNKRFGKEDKLLMNTNDCVEFERKRKICNSCNKKNKKKCNDQKCDNYCSEIWLLTPDLSEDKEGGVYAQVVTNNLKKGIKYTYLVPKDDVSIETKITDIKANNSDNPNLSFIYLDKNFFLSTHLDLAIYNPTAKLKGMKRRAFLGITIEGKNENYVSIPITEDLITTIVGMINKFKTS